MTVLDAVVVSLPDACSARMTYVHGAVGWYVIFEPVAFMGMPFTVRLIVHDQYSVACACMGGYLLFHPFVVLLFHSVALMRNHDFFASFVQAVFVFRRHLSLLSLRSLIFTWPESSTIPMGLVSPSPSISVSQTSPTPSSSVSV